MRSSLPGTLVIKRNLIQLLLDLWKHLNQRRRLQLCFLLVVMFSSSVAEVLSLAAVLPFLAILANPAGLWSLPIVQNISVRIGITRSEDLLLPITLAFAIAVVVAGAIRLFNLWLSGRLAAAIGSDLSYKAYLRTLYQPYSVHVSRNSSELISIISNDVGRVINLVLNPVLLMLSSGLIAVGLIVGLLMIDTVIAIIAALLVALVYFIAVIVSRRPLEQLGKRQAILSKQFYQALNEGLGAIREVILDGTQKFYATSFHLSSQPLARNNADVNFLSTYPRLVLEPVGMAIIAAIGLVLVTQQGTAKALPLLGALALGAQRLLPVVQKVYEGWAQTRNSKSSLENVLKLVNQPISNIEIQTALIEPLEFQRSLQFEQVRFSYGPNLPEILSGIDLDIRRGQRIGVIGSTGSGKSTTIDLMMGLLKPTSGRILVDGVDVNNSDDPSRLLSWRASIANVPQYVYLADASFAENIAFGLSKSEIDMKRVLLAAEQAQIAGFITSLPGGYASSVGERGVRLSGGQRQRIGIARALYKQAQLLILDEATSALDSDTETAVMHAISGLSNDLTIVMIAHRLSTIQKCDTVIRLNKGIVAQSGPPSAIIAMQ